MSNPHRFSTASGQEFFLQELDPSPIDTPPETYELESVPEPNELKKALGRASTLGLSGGGHSYVFYLTRIQKYSSYAFLAFSSLHITNTSIIPLLTRSVSSSDSYLLLTRPYYQTLPLEPLLVTLPLLSHIVSGFLLRLHRRNQTLKRTGAAHVSVAERLRRGLKVWPEVSWASLSGYLLVPLVYGHIAVNRIIPLVVEGGSSGVGLGFVAHGFARHPVLAWTSYSALLGTAVGHMVWGVVKWMGWGPRGSERERRSRRWSINGAVAVITGVWAAGGLGVIARGGADEGWVGKGYDELYKLIPGLG